MSKPQVYLVGAGPGHPELLTLRAVRCLQQADLVLHDKLVSARALEHAPVEAEKICVADLSPRHADRHRPITEIMIEAAKYGKCVVRLKGGDPFIFGRGGEEAEELHKAGIAFEMVPGVTAALGAASFAGIPLTHRAYASGVAFITGHEQPEKNFIALDWESLARFPGTLAVYMGLSRLAEIAQTLIARGKDPQTPAAVVQWASLGDQKSVEGPLSQIADIVRQSGFVSPATIIIGEVVRFREQFGWFEKQPLFGKRVLVTRPEHQAGDLIRRVEDLGAAAYLFPAVEIHEPQDWTPVDRALDQLKDYHWLVFTSTNGVHAFIRRLRERSYDLRALGHLQIAAIGPKTAETLGEYHLKPDLLPDKFQSEHLADALKQLIKPGQSTRFLLARADRGRVLLRDELAKVADVDQIAVYVQKDAPDMNPELMDSLRRGEISFVTVTSSNIARVLANQFDDTCRQRLHAQQMNLVSISPVTSEELRKYDLPVAAEATEATMEGVVDAIVKLAAKLASQI